MVDQFQDKIEDLKFAREWNGMLFDEVRHFYYRQFAFYLLYALGLNWLLLGRESNRDWSWITIGSFVVVAMQTAYMMTQELIQVSHEGFLDYVGDTSNVVETIQICSNIFLICILTYDP